MEKIESFKVNHRYLVQGFYVSRVDGDITTFDLRMRVPNGDEFIDNITLHSIEHMFATIIRNSEIAENVIYFGPMGCRTGFYLLTRNLDARTVFEETKKTLEAILKSDVMYGQSIEECGNYLELDLDAAKRECNRYLYFLKKLSGYNNFRYPEEWLC